MAKVEDVGQLSRVIVDEKALQAICLLAVMAAAAALLVAGFLIAFCGWVYPVIEHWLVSSSAGI